MVFVVDLLRRLDKAEVIRGGGTSILNACIPVVVACVQYSLVVVIVVAWPVRHLCLDQLHLTQLLQTFLQVV